MADVATLGLEIKYSDVDGARLALEKMSSTSKKAEAEAMRFVNAAKRVEAATSLAAERAARAALADERLAAAKRKAAEAMNIQTKAANDNANALARSALSVGAATANSRNLAFQLIDIGQAIPLAFQSPLYALQNLGFQMAQIGQIYMGNGGMRAALRDSISMVGSFAAKLGPAIAVVGALAAALGGMTYEINQAQDVTVGFGDVALATWQVIADGIYSVLAPAISAIGPYAQAAWVGLVAGVKWAGNLIINSFRAAFEDVKFVWQQFPNIIGAAVYGAVTAVVSGIQKMVQTVADYIDILIEKVNAVSSLAGIPEIGKIGKIPFTPLPKNPYSFDEALGERNRRVGEIFASDPLGEAFDAVKVQAVANAMDKAAESTKKAGDAAKGAGNGWKHFGNEARRAAEDTIRLALDIANGFVSDLQDGLARGEGFWRSFANAGLNALNTISGKLLEVATNSLITNLLASLFGGSFLSPRAWGAVQAGGGGLYADGGYTGAGGKYEPAGTVHKGEYVFSAAAVRAIGLGNLERQHRTARRGMASGGYAGGATPRMQAPANQNVGSGTSVIELRLSPELIAQILSQAEGQSIKITKTGLEAHDKRQARDRLRAG